MEYTTKEIAIIFNSCLSIDEVVRCAEKFVYLANYNKRIVPPFIRQTAHLRIRSLYP